MATNQQVWQPDTHKEHLHTRWETHDPDTHSCIAIHVHPEEASRHWRSVPREHVKPQAHRYGVPGTLPDWRLPNDHEVCFHPHHCTNVYEAILAENRLKNEAIRTIHDTLPVEYKRQEVDNDGDLLWRLPDGEHATQTNGRVFRVRDGLLVPNTSVEPILRLKDKHAVRWTLDPETGAVDLSVPGLDPNHLAILRQAVSVAHGPRVTVT